MTTRIRFLACFMNALLAISAHGQTIDYSQYIKPPSATPPSPDAAAIEKFGNVPVTYATGVADISVPLYTIQCGNLNWPLSIAYHSGGIRVDETSSSVGIGWAFSGTGVISRSVVGLPDESTTGSPDYNSVTSSDYSYLYSVWEGISDSELDIYNFSFNGRSGKFLIKQDGTYFQIPYSALRISRDGSGNFTITDENGVTYLFDQKETTSTDNGSHTSSYASSWYLSKALLANKKDSLTFEYAVDGDQVQTYNSFTHAVGEKYTGEPTPLVFFNETSSGFNQISTGVLKPTRINFPNGSAIFTYSGSQRTDLGGVYNQLSNIKINRITSTQTTQIKKWSFSQSYSYYNPLSISSTDPTLYRLRLDSLYEYGDSLSTPPKTYQFEYNSTPMVPRGNYGQDFWGYNNGQYNNVNLIQSQTFVYSGTPYSIGNSDRSVDTTAMKACALIAIHYPTGGKTTFTYEPNRYATNESVTNHVSEGITAFGDGNESPSATFTFPSGTSSVVVQVDMTAYNYTGVTNPSSVKITDLTTSTVIYNQSQTTPSSSVETFPSISFAPGDSYKLEAFVFTNTSVPQVRASISVSYDTTANVALINLGGGLRIKEIKNYLTNGQLATMENYEYDTAMPLTPYNLYSRGYNDVIYEISYGLNDACIDVPAPGSSRVFSSAPTYPLSTALGSPMLYQNVTKIDIDSATGLTNGKTVYHYDVSLDGNQVLSTYYFNAPLLSNEWKNGFLTSEADYKWNGDGYNLIRKTTNQYSEFKDSTVYSLKVAGRYVHYGCTNVAESYISGYANWVAYPTTTGSKKLTQVTDTLYDDNQHVLSTVTKNYYADTTNDFITSTTRVNSKGLLDSTVFRYPQDSASSGNIYQKMVDINMIAPAIQKQNYVGGTLTSTLKTTYRDWNSDNKVIAPEFVQGSIHSNSLENRVQYFGYDSFANILSVAKTADASHSFLWDYDSKYAIVQVANAGQTDIAYTSFEAGGTGNWTIGSNSRDTINAITGTRSYVLASDISKSGLINSTTYIVTYWTQNNSSFTINGTITGYPIKGKTISGWTLYTHRITGDTTLTITGTGHIDELRLYPLGAQMTTYTYLPLVGMTSQCDAGNRITYYQYDDFARLARILDQDKNILKTLDYQYQAAGGCGSNCYISQMQTLAGTNTISYPVGVFNVHGKLLGNATNQSGFISLWNADTADSHVATISAGADSMHFHVAVDSGETLPAVTGCRYYQYDLPWTQLDGVRNFNGVYVDFGDSTGMYLGKNLADTPSVLAANTTYKALVSTNFYSAISSSNYSQLYLIHSYPDTNTKTITFYHNDASENSTLDNANSPATSLLKVRNLRGNLPANSDWIGGSAYQISTASTVANIGNWNKISSIKHLWLNRGDGINSFSNIGYTQDFLQSDKGLQTIETVGVGDTSFKLTRLRSDWNTYYTNLQQLIFSDNNWNRENVSSLSNLWWINFNSTKSVNNAVVDSIIIQMAAGPAQNIRYGVININWSGCNRTSASDTALAFIKSRGWLVTINGTLE